MNDTFNLARTKVRPMHNNNSYVSRAMININDIKYDLLKISDMFDGVLQEGLGYLAADMLCKYLQDMCNQRWIYSFDITEIVLKEHSYTYDLNIQITNDRTPKKLKIHIGLYKSAWPDISPFMKSTDNGYARA